MARSLRHSALISAGFILVSALPVRAAVREQIADARENAPARHDGTVVVASTSGSTGHVLARVSSEPIAYGLVCAGCLAAITFVRRRKRLSASRRRDRDSF